VDLDELCDRIERVARGYSRRFGIEQDDDWHILKLAEEMGELTKAYLMRIGKARDKGLTGAEIKAKFAQEMADVIGQVLLTARHFDVDIETELERKWLVWELPQD
jgi:NTP pyrophosphatase (non-canonical NTP hydrolase)